MRTSCRVLSTALLLAVATSRPTVRRCPDRRRFAHGPRHRSQRRRRPRRDRHGHQPGHERGLHGDLERGRQLHDHLAAGRHLRGQGRADRLQDADHAADPARGEADRAPRLQAGGRRARGDGRGHGESPVLQTESATVGEVISGTTLVALPLNGRNTGQLIAAAPGRRHAEPRLVHGGPQLRRRRTALRERQPRADQQLHDRRRRHERVDRQPRGLPAEPGRAGRDQRRDQQLRGRHRQRGRRRHQQRHQVGLEPVPRQRVRVLPQQRHGRELLVNNRSNAAKPERRQDIYGGTLGGPLVKNKLFFFANYQGTRFDAPGFETHFGRARQRGATAICRASPRHPRPATGLAFAGNQIPAGRISPIARSILSNTALYPLPNRNVSGGVTGNYVGETLTTIARQPGRRARSTGTRRTTTRSSDASRIAEFQSRTDKRAFPLLLGSLHGRAVPQSGVQLEPRLQSVGRQRAARRLQPDHDRERHPRLGRRRQRQRDVRDCGRAADPGPELDRMGRRPDDDRRRRERHRHARQDLSDQREAHLAQGPPLAEVRRPVAALRPAALLRGQQRAARPLRLQRRVHRIRVLRLPARPGGRARAAAASRTPGRTCTTASRSSSRTTSS